MPVADHPVHEKTRIAEDAPYTCRKRQAVPPPYPAKHGFTEDGRQIFKPTEHVMSTLCRYMDRKRDKRCNGCPIETDLPYIKERGLLDYFNHVPKKEPENGISE